MATSYEMTYIVRPDLESDAKKALIERFDGILTDNGGYREGVYHIINFTAEDDAAINEFDRLAKISQDILRHMIIKRDAE